MQLENAIAKHKNVLIVLWENTEMPAELDYLIQHFCGQVLYQFPNEVIENQSLRYYFCGNAAALQATSLPFLYLVAEFTTHHEHLDTKNTEIISLGKVPIVLSKAGVYFRNLFGEGDYFNRIKSEHVFQELTESNKASKALRKGIYLTEILKEITQNNDEILHYRLLRCSSNFTGATDNFRATDKEIMHLLNESAKQVFEQPTQLNHVLAQIYENRVNTNDKERTKEAKSKISAHSDKTKDMPKEGLIAFCTFYDTADFERLRLTNTNRFDWVYKQATALTKLHFKLKNTVQDDTLEKEFTVTLYPNSAFLIPLSTNRLYTHEIRPSMLNIDQIPTRMGYVARCSNLEALHMHNQTYIKTASELVPLEQMTDESLENLRHSYVEENKTEKMVEYGKVHFSMNSGDYEKPIF
jgi:hypothetical protein